VPWPGELVCHTAIGFQKGTDDTAFEGGLRNQADVRCVMLNIDTNECPIGPNGAQEDPLAPHCVQWCTLGLHVVLEFLLRHPWHDYAYLVLFYLNLSLIFPS
jgi:hypothetical protein